MSRDDGVGRRALVLTNRILTRRSLLGLAVAALALAAVWTVVGLSISGGTAVAEADAALLDAVTERRTAPAVAVARVATFLADLWVVAAVTAVLLAVTWRWSGRGDLALLIGTVVVGSLAVTGAVKVGTDRVRPDEGLVSVISSSFPSGHSSRGVALYGVLAWLALRWGRRWWRAVVAAAAGMLAVLTGLSRVVLGVHWPSDVLAGALLGAIWLGCTLRIAQPAAPP